MAERKRGQLGIQGEVARQQAFPLAGRRTVLWRRAAWGAKGARGVVGGTPMSAKPC